MAVDVQRDEAEVWFRRRGLPLVVHGSAQGRALIARTGPALVFLAVLVLIDIWLQWFSLEPESDGSADETSFGYFDVIVGLLAVAVMYLILPILAVWMTRKALRRRSDTVQFAAGVVAIVLSVALLPVAAAANGYASYLGGLVTAVVSVSALLLLVRLGVGAILIWAIRKAAQQVNSIGTMASRVLPLLLLVVMFAFFTGELWQAANALSRSQLWVVVAFLALLAVGFMAATFSDELPALREASRARADLLARLQGTPLRGTTATAGQSRLTGPERLNVLLLLFLAQAVQVVAFVVVVFVFFVVFGVLMITPGVQETYLSAPLPAEATFFGIPVPVSNALFQVSLFLAAFSGLYFTASKTTDERYRRAFFEPLIDEIALSLAARDVYRERWPQQ